jgi:hypothetical protein
MCSPSIVNHFEVRTSVFPTLAKTYAKYQV